MTDPRTELVAAGYDAMIDTWEAWKAQITDDPRADWCADLVSRLTAGAHVVELGCGGGTAETALLAAPFELTCVDLSERQLERAQARVPEARYVLADIAEVDFPAGSLAAVASFYVLNHFPRALLPHLFERIHRWLRPDGLLLITLGASDLPGWTGEWLGAPTYFSGHEPDVNRRLLVEAGFEIVRDEVVTIQEPEGDATFHWVLARR